MFGAALAALAELLGGTPPAGDEERRELAVEAPDRPALLADWIAELAYLAESRGFVAERAERLELTADGLTAAVVGRRGSPPPLVKAVTYHRLECGPSQNGWRGRVVLDV